MQLPVVLASCLLVRFDCIYLSFLVSLCVASAVIYHLACRIGILIGSYYPQKGGKGEKGEKGERLTISIYKAR